MSPYEFTGTLVAMGDEKTFASGFRKREFVLQDMSNSSYPNLVPFTLKKDNCSLLDNVKQGASIKVSFYLNGHKWEDPKSGNVRYFCDNDAVKVEVMDAGYSVVPEPAEPTEADMSASADDEEMPF